MVPGKFTGMLWNTGIHSMANWGRKFENDQDKFINNVDLRNDNDMAMWQMNSENEVLWLIAQFTRYGLTLAGVSNIRICYDNLHCLNDLKGNKV